VSIKRNIKYKGNAATFRIAADSNIKLVWWCDTFGTPGGEAPAQDQLKMLQRAVTYFKDPK
jgi:hypothetical protein